MIFTECSRTLIHLAIYPRSVLFLLFWIETPKEYTVQCHTDFWELEKGNSKGIIQHTPCRIHQQRKTVPRAAITADPAWWLEHFVTLSSAGRHNRQCTMRHVYNVQLSMGTVKVSSSASSKKAETFLHQQDRTFGIQPRHELFVHTKTQFLWNKRSPFSCSLHLNCWYRHKTRKPSLTWDGFCYIEQKTCTTNNTFFHIFRWKRPASATKAVKTSLDWGTQSRLNIKQSLEFKKGK